MNITKSAPLPERPCEQLTCCEKNGSVRGNYINRVTKRHNCRITGKTKATAEGRQRVLQQIERITNNATFAAGGKSVTGKNSGGIWWAILSCAVVGNVSHLVFFRQYRG